MSNVYQATEMHVTITQPTAAPARYWLETWYAWAALLVAMLTVVTLALDLPGKLGQLWGDTAQETVVLQTLAGVIWDENQVGLAEVEVFLPELNVTTSTDQRGYFTVQVRASHQRSVDLIASKAGYVTRREEATLGNPALHFVMRQQQ